MPFDITATPDLSQQNYRSGPVRAFKPVYMDFLPPCNQGCPAGENIQAWLYEVEHGNYQKAWEIIVRDNPFPAIHGRVCYHPCESACNRKDLDDPIGIHNVERFLGDFALENKLSFKKPKVTSGKKVLIIGAGPSGLSAAYHLTILGHQVEVIDLGAEPGGMMRYGIPSYRLPRDILSGEINRLTDIGVRFRLNYKVADVLAEKENGEFDAVFVAVGAHLAKRVDIPIQDASKVLDAIKFLRDVAGGEKPQIGRKVAIYGGGNTAMDAARTAKRLGAQEAVIIYRRTREQMPAHEEEADEALSEGIKINWLKTISAFTDESIEMEIMELDENGYPQPTGKKETIPADSVILALGQDSDTDFLTKIEDIEFKKDGTVIVNSQMMTGHPGIFAGGDMVPSERTVTVAIGHGKKAAKNIDAWLTHKEPSITIKHDVVNLSDLNLWYFGDLTPKQPSHIPPEESVKGFIEVVSTLSEEDARFEAGRCLSCGNCFECDGCFAACPEQAVIRLGKGNRYKFNYDLCTGCRACFEQCPVHAIEMVDESEAVRQRKRLRIGGPKYGAGTTEDNS